VAPTATLALVLFASPARAAKTDVVVLRNGDRLTGEVEQLERGRLSFKTDDMGTVEIEWDKVASVSATAPFDVDDLHGNRYLGSLAPAPAPGQVVIAWKGLTAAVDLAAVVRIRRLDTSFWKRLDGSLDVGASYTSASELFKLDAGGTLGFERPGYEISADASATLSTQTGVDDTRRSQLSVVYVHRFRNRWVALGQAQLEQNRELGFELRTSAAAGGGRYLAQSQRQRFLAGLGLSVNRERPVGDADSTTNVEATALLSYDRFSYDFPKVDVTLVVAGFASFTEGGRYRLDVEGRLKRELVKDFHATLRGYESYDSRPPTEGAPHNDFGITFALGWSF
jgi:putative salt-induced outer membrane protein YdiY